MTTKLGTATLVKEGINGFMGFASVYKVTPRPEGWNTDYVVASSVASAFDTGRPETMVFPATKTGRVKDWEQLGVVRYQDHAAALRDAGWELVADK